MKIFGSTIPLRQLWAFNPLSAKRFDAPYTNVCHFYIYLTEANLPLCCLIYSYKKDAIKRENREGGNGDRKTETGITEKSLFSPAPSDRKGVRSSF